MNSRTTLAYVSTLALATGAAVIGQNQPTQTPSRPPTATQPSTSQPSSSQPSNNQPGQLTDQKWRDMAGKIQQSNDRMTERNQTLAQQLAQAQTQTGEARVNAIAEVLTGVLQEQQHTNREIVHLQRLVFRTHLESANMGNEWDSWKQQYPFLDDSKDTDEVTGTGNEHRDRNGENPHPETTTPPRNPR